MSPANGRVLRGITWDHPRGYDCLVASSALYRQQTGVEVGWDFRSLQAFADAPLAALAADYDLLVIDHPHVPQAATDGVLAELDGVGFDTELATLATQSVGASHASYAYAGHHYGLATDAAAQVAVYRPDLLTEPPTDWEGVLELARAGRVLWPAKPIDAFSSLISVAGSQGAVLTPEPGVFLADADAERAMALLHHLSELVPPPNLRANPIQVAERLSQDDTWAYAPLLFGYTNYSRVGFRPHRLRYIDVPAGPAGPVGSLLGGAGLAVSASSTQLDAARTYAFWVASVDVQRGVYFEGGGQPGNRLAWEDDATNAETWDFFRGTRASLEQAYLRPRSVRYLEFQDTVSPLVNGALSGDLSDRQLIGRIRDEAERLLGDLVDADR